MRVSKLLKSLLGLGKLVVIFDWNLDEETTDTRAELAVWIRQKVRRRGRCGQCGVQCAWEDHGGGERTWRHID